MRNLRSLHRQARDVVMTARGPLGVLCTQQVIAEHIAFFEALRSTGASWQQIAEFMAGLGLRSRKGDVVTAGVLKVLYARAVSGSGPVARKVRAKTSGKASVESGARIEATSSRLRTSQGVGSVTDIIERAVRIRQRDEQYDA